MADADGSTFLELQEQALADDFDATKYRPHVQRWLNEAVGRVRRRVRLPSAETVYDLALTGGQAQYELPADALRLAKVQGSAPFRDLVEIDADDIDANTTVSGVPSRFAISADTLIVDPTPAGSETLRLRFWSRGTRMVADTDRSGVHVDYEDLLITYARSRLFRAEDDFEAAQLLMAEFKAELAEARGDLQRRSENRARQVPGTWGRGGTSPRFVRP